MSGDYLWDGTGDPDPEVQRLEHLLKEFRHKGEAPALPRLEPIVARPRWRFWRAPWLWPAFALAGAVMAVGAWIAFHPRQALPSWNVARLAGSPRVGSSILGESGHLRVGEWLETDASSRAIVQVASSGEVRVDPNTRVRLVKTIENQHRMALAHGTIHAMIWALPGRFVVDTPSATVVDLGCAYTLHGEDTGAGLIQVDFGWVGFRTRGREAFIPEGAVCATHPGFGLGTPYFENADEKFKEALAQLDFANLPPQARGAALAILLSTTRRRDALTLWHLLSRLEGTERARVFDSLASFVPPPVGVTRDGILRGDQAMRDLWWNALGLGDTSWWRMWEQNWHDSSR